MPFITHDVLALFTVAVFVITAVVHLTLAVGVLYAANELVSESKRVYFMPPAIWCLAVLLTGLLGATAYWLMHHSTLRRDL